VALGRLSRFAGVSPNSCHCDKNHRREKYISAKSAFATRILSLKQSQRKPQKTLLVDVPAAWNWWPSHKRRKLRRDNQLPPMRSVSQRHQIFTTRSCFFFSDTPAARWIQPSEIFCERRVET
jgi:hypothetical protein